MKGWSFKAPDPPQWNVKIFGYFSGFRSFQKFQKRQWRFQKKLSPLFQNFGYGLVSIWPISTFGYLCISFLSNRLWTHDPYQYTWICIYILPSIWSSCMTLWQNIGGTEQLSKTCSRSILSTQGASRESRPALKSVCFPSNWANFCCLSFTVSHS